MLTEHKFKHMAESEIWSQTHPLVLGFGSGLKMAEMFWGFFFLNNMMS